MSACVVLYQSFSYPKKKYAVCTFLKEYREIEKIVKELRRKLEITIYHRLQKDASACGILMK